MTTTTALTKEQLTTLIELIERMEQLGEQVSRLEVNFGAGTAGELVRDGAQITFVPKVPASRARAPREKQDTYPYAN